MWDLIVSVPDHCLSFYSKLIYCIQFLIYRLHEAVLLKNGAGLYCVH